MLTLEELLPIVQKKYPDAELSGYKIYYNRDYHTLQINKQNKIEKNTSIAFPLIEQTINDTILLENNIIELKHYLGIEITKEDIIKQFKDNKKFVF